MQDWAYVQSMMSTYLQMHLQMHFGEARADALYVPARLSVNFMLAVSAFAERRVHHMLAVPATLGVISQSASEFEVSFVNA